MKILHTESSCGWGGQELRIIAEAIGMAERGHRVRVAAAPESRLAAEAGRRGIDVAVLPIARKGWRGVAALRRALLDTPADVVNCHSSTDSWLAALALASMRSPPPLVRTRHISAPIPPNAATRWLYRRATAHVVTTGERLREQVIRETGLAPDRVSSVPTGIDLAHFSPGDRDAARAHCGLHAEAFVVGIVATLRSWKGHRYLVDAIAAIDDPRVLLAVVGDGPGAGNLRAQVASLGLGERVVLPGHRDDVLPWLRAMDLFALPSYANEGVPQAIQQAMACGVAVITTATGAIGEIVEDGRTGVMVEPRSAEALRDAIVRLKDDSAARARLARAGREFALGRFGRERMLDRMEAVFARVSGRA